jgi:hypothetical protein
VAATMFQHLPSLLGGRTSRLARAARVTLAIAAACAFALAAWTVRQGTVHVELGGMSLIRNSELERPLLIGIVLLWLAGYYRALAPALAVLPLVFVLPLYPYRGMVDYTRNVARPLRAIRDCGVALQASGASVGSGLYNAGSEVVYHSYFYYLRRLGPWVWTKHPEPEEMKRRLLTPGQESPILLSQRDYDLWALTSSREPTAGASSAAIASGDGVVVLLPGAYEVCVPAAIEAGARPATRRAGDVS